MNKAFVKDDDSWDDPEITRDPHADIPAGSRNYITPAGMERLRGRLRDLIDSDRPRIEQELNTANQGGQDENTAILRDLRKFLRRVDSEIEFLTVRLSLTETVNPLKQESDAVRFGATVTIQPETGPEKTYSIVGIDESDIEKSRISWTSPLARALLNKRVGELVKVRTPGGIEELEIVDLRYYSIE